MIKPGHMIKADLDNLKAKSATVQGDTEQDILKLSIAVEELLETMQYDIDLLCNGLNSNVTANHSSRLDALDMNFSKLGSLVRTIAESHNSLAEEVDKLKKIFTFIMEKKEARESGKYENHTERDEPDRKASLEA